MSRDNERFAHAGDYVLGLLDDDARAEAERDMERDPEFAETVRRLAERMSSLDHTAKPAEVPAGMWDEILGKIATLPQDHGTSPPAQSAANQNSATHTPPWRKLALAASLAAAFGLGYAGGFVMKTVPEPVVLVVLQTPDNTTGAVFEAFADNSVKIIPLADFEVPQDKIMQVWTLYDASVGPVSLGTLSSAEVTTLKGQKLPVPAADQLYEITLEPRPGSPTGKPTGPILVKGFAKRPAG
ncbi:anti-sigma factor [Aminobacter sp. MDW-2]|uniref:anti-sigma factor n=1 Tax=Aminobacter sp. MDW-2 TaxID=2666139 RepID=UPI0012B01785|nr:anti-sigma factor [Aminobacter sp. MDW-2]MRX32959.1 anti-sigma factor [Aminobacter sp. MDW-2]QNH36599.1 anti-sigma factor [Aminobacter sp. MDW-2]